MPLPLEYVFVSCLIVEVHDAIFLEGILFREKNSSCYAKQKKEEIFTMRWILSKKRAVLIAGLILAGILSFSYVSKVASEPSTYRDFTKTLDDKRDAVLTLTIGSTIAANMISALPDDTGSPLVDELSNISTVLMFVQVAIFIEKYMMPVAGYLLFKAVIPILSIMIIFGILFNNYIRTIKKLACGMLIISVALYALAPVSVILSQIIERTCSESISEALSLSENIAELMDSADDSDEEGSDDERNLFEKAADAASSVFHGITSGVSFFIDAVQELLGCLLEVIVIFVVTTIIIPLAALYGMVKISKLCIVSMMKSKFISSGIS